MKRILVLLLIALAPSLSFGHARLISPTPRNNNAGIKVGPCGNVPRTGVNTTWTVGQTVTIEWEETINHPGKFLFAISPANDQGFENNMVKMVLDDQDQGVPLPHKFSTTIVVPNIPCENCTFQMIQSMEENPNNPTYYYSCADIRIVPAAAPTPTPGEEGSDQSSQGANGQQNAPIQQKFGGYGCGTVGSVPPPNGANGVMIASLTLMMMIFLTYLALRRTQLCVSYALKKSRADYVSRANEY